MGKYNKNYKDDKRERNPKEDSRPIKTPSGEYLVQSLAFDSLVATDSSLNLINATLVSPGASGSEQEVGYINGYFDTSGVLLDNGTFAMVDDSITALLEAFGTARGYATTVTVTDIRNYFIRSARAFSILLTYQRYYNGAKLIDRNGKSMSNIVAQRIRGVSLTAAPKALIESATVNTSTESATDSNAIWAQTYLSQLHKLRMPKNWFEFMVKMFSGVHAIADARIPSYLVLYDESLNKSVTHATEFATQVAAIDALLAKPDLISILDFMGFKPLGVGLDFTRDLKGRTLFITADAQINDLFGNGSWFDFCDTATDTDIKYLVSGSMDPLSPFSASEQLEASAETLKHLALLSKRLTTTVNIQAVVAYYQAGIGWTTSYLINPITIIGVTSDGSITTSDIVARLTGAATRWVHYCGSNLGYTVNMNVTVASSMASVTLTVTSGVVEGGSTYVIPEDILWISRVTALDNIFGVPWRSALQSLVSNMPLSPLRGKQ